MTGTSARGRIAGIAAAFAVGIGSGAAARAGEDDPMVARVAALEASIAEHTAGKALDALLHDIGDALALYQENGAKDPHRERILKALGGLAKHRAEDVLKAAIGALAKTHDPDGVKYFRGYLRPLDDKTPPPTSLEAAIDAAKQVPDDSLVDPLLSIVDDSKNLPISVKAMEALSTYGRLKRSREHVLDALTKCVAKLQTGRKGYGSAGAGGGVGDASGDSGGGSVGSGQAGPAERWQALSAALPGTLNALTGQHESSAQEWFDLVKASKGKLGSLFLEPAADGK